MHHLHAAKFAGSVDGIGIVGQFDRHVLGAYQHRGGVGGGTVQQRDALAEHHGLLTVGDSRQTVGQADEGGHVFRAGAAVQRLRVGDLLDAAVVHHADAVGHGKGFFLVVGHEHGGGAGFELDAADFVSQLHAHFGVQCGQRLVEQQHTRVHGQRTGQGHALLLAAGHLLRVLFRLVGKSDQFQFLHGLAAAFRTVHASDFKAEFHVLQRGHVREQRVGLEHHGHVTLVDGHAGHVLAADEDASGLNVFQSGQGAQRGGFAAAGAAQQHHHFARIDFQVEIVQRLDGRTGVDLVYTKHLHTAAARFGILEHGLRRFGHHVGFGIGERFRGMGNHRLLFGESHELSPSLF